jgi:aryl-alcohol dehydrogenase-like predicted oxidoreductase
MVEAVEGSLRRLGTDHIDLYQVHAWDGLTPVEEILQGLDDLVRQGKVVYGGLSNTPAWICGYAAATATVRGWAPLVTIQTPYSLLDRSVERELLPMAEALDLSLLAYNPLGRGILTGRHRRGEGGRRDLGELDDRARTIADEVVAVADDIAAAPAQVALAWLRGSSPNVIPIIGASSLSQLESNLGCVAVALDDEHRRRLDAATAIDLGHPSQQLASERMRHMLTSGRWDRIDFHRPPLNPSPFSRPR